MLISIFSTYALYTAIKRINNLESVLVTIQEIISYSDDRIKKLDSTGHFESDDEVGFFFEEVQRLQSIMNDLFESTENEEKINEKN
tara:strand:+ start:778 stop:1035 length:258 start_codon:yes stop_codon:yes gene_type:complete